MEPQTAVVDESGIRSELLWRPSDDRSWGKRCLSRLWGKVSRGLKGEGKGGLNDTVTDLQKAMLRYIDDDAFLGSAKVRKSKCSTICGLPLPLSSSSAEMLYQWGEDAMVGVEGKGDVLDEKLRKTKERNVDALRPEDLPEELKNFDFPEEVERIRATLCPTAEKVVVKPYKLLVYGHQDFFTIHKDSMNDPMQFGSLALQIPVEPSVLEYEDSECYERQDKWWQYGSEPGAKPGDLVLYCGRSVEPELSSSSRGRQELLRGNNHDFSYERPKDRECMILRLRHSTAMGRHPKGCLLFEYAAWLGDTPHEVLPIDKGYRVVLIYRLFKANADTEGPTSTIFSRPLDIVHREELDNRIARLFSLLAESRWSNRIFSTAEEDSEKDSDYSSSSSSDSDSDTYDEVEEDKTYQVRHVGILLRHQYPPNGLQPNALKGIDAAAYELFARHHRCYLATAFEMHTDMVSSPFRILETSRYFRRNPLLRTVFRSADEKDFHSYDSLRTTVRTKPMILDCVWMQLGLGSLIAGGAALGNGDCGTDWWYRHAVMVVTQEPSNWERRRSAFYLGIHGSPAMQWLYSVWDVFEQVVWYI